MAWHGEFMNCGREHSGSIVSVQKPVGRILRELPVFLQTHSTDEVRNQLFFL